MVLSLSKTITLLVSLHGYSTIADEVVWSVLETNLPVLTREVLESAGKNRRPVIIV